MQASTNSATLGRKNWAQDFAVGVWALPRLTLRLVSQHALWTTKSKTPYTMGRSLPVAKQKKVKKSPISGISTEEEQEQKLILLTHNIFEKFKALQPAFAKVLKTPGLDDVKSFAVAEFLRFYSMGGTILANFANLPLSFEARTFTHIVLRSLLEHYFWILYIFCESDSRTWSARFDEYMDGFKREYVQLYKEPLLPHKTLIEPPGPKWDSIKQPKDMKSVLAAVMNDYGHRLDYLYFVYRITSFDIHGKTLPTLFIRAFHKPCNFPALKIKNTIDLIANEYLVVWQKIV